MLQCDRTFRFIPLIKSVLSEIIYLRSATSLAHKTTLPPLYSSLQQLKAVHLFTIRYLLFLRQQCMMNVTIRTMSLLNSLHDRKRLSLKPRSGKTLYVDLSGEQHVRSWIQCQLHVNAKKLAESNGMDVFTSKERSELFSQNVCLSVSDFPDDIDSLCLTDGVVHIIFVVFKSMHHCEQIIINCRQGRNRSPMIASRLAALIKDGKNESCEEAYDYYLQLCKHVNENFDPNRIITWPNLCTNTWTQMAVCIFMRSKRSMYPPTGGGIHFDHPEGKLNCVYNDYDSDQTVPFFDIESIYKGDDMSDSESEDDDCD